MQKVRVSLYYSDGCLYLSKVCDDMKSGLDWAHENLTSGAVAVFADPYSPMLLTCHAPPLV